MDDSKDLAPQELSVLAEQIFQQVRDAGQPIGPLEELLEIHGAIWAAHDRIRARATGKEEQTRLREEIDGLEARRQVLIDKFDASLDFPAPHFNENSRASTHTPGELCDRLLAMTLKFYHTQASSSDATIPADSRLYCIEKTKELRKWRGHLRLGLAQLFNDLKAGSAVLPPRSEFKLYNHPSLNPLKRAEGTPLTELRRFPLIDAKYIVGLACTGHGAGLALVGADGELRATTLDRWAGTKHTLMFSADEERDIILSKEPDTLDAGIREVLVQAFGKIPPYRVFESTIHEWMGWFLRDTGVTREDIGLLVVSESYFCTNAGRLRPRLNEWFPNAKVIGSPEHHEIHQRQAFWQSGFDEAAILTMDTCGESLGRLGGKSISGTISVMNRDGHHETLREFYFPEQSAGLVYALVSAHCGFVQGEEGKTMGLAPYGRPHLYEHLKRHLVLHDDGSFQFLSLARLISALNEYVPRRGTAKDAPILPKHEDVAFAGQAILQDIMTNAWKAALRLTGQKKLVCAGGVSLNSVANEIAFRAARPDDFYVSPNPGDTGHALGAALLGAYEVARHPVRPVQIHDYLGPDYTEADYAAVIQATDAYKETLAEPEEKAARVIANGYISARFAGRAEFGPRALGNRSIVADPRRNDMKDFLNAKVKFREGFRPFAPSALEEFASEWFDIEGSSPYMLRVVPVLEHKRHLVPSIVHADGSGRLQTVGNENPGYRKLIEAFRALTGVPMVLNTSFNVAGKPIVETPQDAVDCFMGTAIDVLILGNTLLSKRPLIEYLEKERAPLG